ncbi:MAG: hypothetical protein QM778_06030 [Myxococcales bacterium]
MSSKSLPFAVGESPFRVKGSICRGCVEYLSEHARGGLASVLAALPDPALRRYFEQSFLASAWYDSACLDPLLATAARLEGQRYESYLNQVFDTQAARNQRGVYKLLLSAISPEMLVKRLPGIGSQLFSFTRSEVREIAPGHWENAITGVPALLQTIYCESSGAFVSRALRTTGARELQHRWLEPRPAPSVHGVAILTVVRELRWRVG